MREIKYRFLREDNVYVTGIALMNGKPFREENPRDNRYVRVFNDNGVGEDYYSSWATYKKCTDIIKIEQYTGLKCLNQIEVYENDVFDIDGKIYFVEYVEDKAGFVLTTGNGYDSKNCIDLDCDLIWTSPIIGNINQNPELLND